MKRVLILSLAYFPKYVGGAEIAIKEITNRIDASDIEFHMVTLRFDSTLPAMERIGNVLVHRIGFSRPNPSITDLNGYPLRLNKHIFQFLAAWKALSLHREHHYDAVWAMMAHSSGIPAAIFKIFRPSVPYILTLQEGDRLEKIERMMIPLWPLFARVFKTADVIQVISTFLGKWARRRGFVGRLEVIPNGVDVARFSRPSMPAEINAIKDGLGKRMGDVFLVTMSRLVHKNAIDVVIKALSHLPPNVRFIVIGIGPDEHSLRKLARKIGVDDRVTFVGEIQNNDIPKYLQASDIFVRASRSEGFGISFVEAFAAGIPVIATQEGGIADFLFDEKRNPDKPITGWAVDMDSPDQVALAVKDIMEHPEKVRAVVATARAMAAEKYDWNIVAHDMKEKIFDPLFIERG
ncbi:MAG: glycosyltransferase family 4 protein [Candidatus Paceibacterota bacterium]